MIDTLVSRIRGLQAAVGSALVAIDGPGGAGKTFLAECLSNELAAGGTPVSVVHGDDFYLPSSRRHSGSVADRPVGADFDWCRLRDQVLLPLRRGERASYDQYDWNDDVLIGGRQVSTGRVVIVEGVYTARRELVDLYDLFIWVDCPREVRLARGIARDGENARERWERDWMVAEDRYIAAQRPADRADVVVSGAPADAANRLPISRWTL